MRHVLRLFFEIVWVKLSDPYARPLREALWAKSKEAFGERFLELRANGGHQCLNRLSDNLSRILFVP